MINHGDVHDNIIESYFVDLENRKIVLNTVYYGFSGNIRERTTITFDNAMGHKFEDQAKNSSIFEIEERSIDEHIKLHKKTRDILDDFEYYDFHFHYVKELIDQMKSYNLKYYMIGSSFGLNGWVLAEKMTIDVKKVKLKDFDSYSKFKDINELRRSLKIPENKIELLYNGNEYILYRLKEKSKLIYAIYANSQDLLEYDFLDEMLDDFKVDGIRLRDFILKAAITYRSQDQNEILDREKVKLNSFDELNKKLAHKRLDLQMSRNGKWYYLACNLKKCKRVFTFAANKDNENRLMFNSFDEMLDGYKENGIPLRDFILDMHIEFEY